MSDYPKGYVHDLLVGLFTKAKNDPVHRFDRLYHYLYDPTVLLFAYRHVESRRPTQTKGVDHQSLLDVRDPFERNKLLADLAEDLRTGTYRPSPAKGNPIPGGRGEKVRWTAVSTLRDAIVQTAVHTILTPIFEADSHEASLGYRKFRRVSDAVTSIRSFIDATDQPVSVFRTDLDDAFGSVLWRLLANQLRRRLHDDHLISLIHAGLIAGVRRPNRKLYEVNQGVHQGTTLAPLLFNIALDPLDVHLSANIAGEPAMFVRWGDDLLLLHRGSGGAGRGLAKLERELRDKVEHLGFNLSPEGKKTIHSTCRDGFTFLGLQYRRGGPAKKLEVRMTRDKCEELMDRITDRVRETPATDTAKAMLEKVNQTIQGIGGHYIGLVPRRTLRRLDQHTLTQVRLWLRRKHPGWGDSDIDRNYWAQDSFEDDGVKLLSLRKQHHSAYRRSFLSYEAFVEDQLQQRRGGRVISAG